MESLTRAERYLFIIALVVAVLVYSKGANLLAQTVGPEANTLLQTAQGRNSQGNFADYAGGTV